MSRHRIALAFSLGVLAPPPLLTAAAWNGCERTCPQQTLDACLATSSNTTRAAPRTALFWRSPRSPNAPVSDDFLVRNGKLSSIWLAFDPAPELTGWDGR